MFYFKGEIRQVIIDLTPARPFILSTNSAIPKKQKRPTPTLNFLKAHLKGLLLAEILMAEKPNRTLILTFHGERQARIEFECFPHGQCLKLFSGGKSVTFPKPKPKNSADTVSFVPVESSLGWNINEKFAEHLGLLDVKIPTGVKQSFISGQILKTQKALGKMDENRESFVKSTEEKIAALELKANSMEDRSKIDSVYSDIKKLRRRILEYGERKNVLASRIKDFQSFPHQEEAPELQKNVKFSGTRVFIDNTWELWVGRNAAQNDELIRLASPHELWIHMRDYASAHGLLRGPKNSVPPEKEINFSCQVVAQLSKSKKKSFQEGEVFDFIVTPRKYVKKKKGMAAGAVIVERETVRRIAFREVPFTVRGKT